MYSANAATPFTTPAPPIRTSNARNRNCRQFFRTCFLDRNRTNRRQTICLHDLDYKLLNGNRCKQHSVNAGESPLFLSRATSPRTLLCCLPCFNWGILVISPTANRTCHSALSISTIHQSQWKMHKLHNYFAHPPNSSSGGELLGDRLLKISRQRNKSIRMFIGLKYGQPVA